MFGILDNVNVAYQLDLGCLILKANCDTHHRGTVGLVYILKLSGYPVFDLLLTHSKVTVRTGIDS